jgi:hypothetical protein
MEIPEEQLSARKIEEELKHLEKDEILEVFNVYDAKLT